MARVPVPATTILKLEVPAVFKIRISKVFKQLYLQMLQLRYSKFIEINAKKSALNIALYKVKREFLFYRYAN